MDLGFCPGLGIGSDLFPSGVYSSGLQANGQIIIGGFFSSVDGLARTNLARLNSDGAVDPSFNVTFSSSFAETEVRSVAVLSNNQILVGGTFDQINGVDQAALVRLNPDGTLDRGFNPVVGSGVPSVDLIVVQPDGKVLIGGFFFSINGDPVQGVARLNGDGTIDPSFDAGANLWSGVKNILVQPDGRLLCLVDFYNSALELHTNVIRLNSDGSWDSTFVPAFTDVSVPYDAIALQPDGKILVTGRFTELDGAMREGAARLLTNGMLDATFSLTNSIGTIYTNGGSMNFVAVQPDGKVLLSGAFSTGRNAAMPSLARFLPSGVLDPTFQPAGFYRSDIIVHDLKFLSDRKLLIAGEFADVNGYSRSGIAQLQGDPILPPRFLSITRQPSGAMQLLLTNPATQPLILEVTTNLHAPQWTALATNLSLSNRLNFQDTNAPSSRSRFYRAYLKEP